MTNLVGKTMLFEQGEHNKLKSYIPVTVLEYCKKGIVLVQSLDSNKDTFEVHNTWLSSPDWANL